jgi:AraC-like DNA-binding protein
MHKIKQIEIDSRAFRPKDRLDAWNGVLSDLTEVRPQQKCDDYVARLEGFDLKHAVFGQTWSPGFDVCRDKKKLATHEATPIVVYFCEAQSWDAWGNGPANKPGDVIFADYTRTFLTKFTKGNLEKTGIFFDRKLLQDRLSGINDLHGHFIPAADPRARLFVRTAKLIQKTLPLQYESDAPILAEHFADLISACLKPKQARNENESHALQDAKRLVVQAFIEANLRDPNLGPAMICAQCGLSQSRLYDLIPGQGGVANYIWGRRLVRAADDLRDPAKAKQSVLMISEGLGFSTASHFSTAFKRKYGAGPRDWRRGPYDSIPVHDAIGPDPANTSNYLCQLLEQRLNALGF